MTEAEKMTHAEWQRRERIERCAEDGHTASTFIRELGVMTAIRAYCDCGQVVWYPKERG